MSDIADEIISFFTGAREEMLQNFDTKIQIALSLVEISFALSGLVGEEPSTYLFVDSQVRAFRLFGSAGKDFIKLREFYDSSLIQPGLIGTIKEITSYLTEDKQYQPRVKPHSMMGLTLDYPE